MTIPENTNTFLRSRIAMRTNLASRVRELRYTKGWGPDDLAERAKISRTALYHLETGRTERPQAATLRRLARALGVTPEELLREGEGVVRPSKGGEGPSGEPSFPQPGLRVDELLQLIQGSGGTPARVAERVAPVETSAVAPEVARKAVEKFLVLLSSPMAGGLIQLVDDSFRLLPMLSTVGGGRPAESVEPADETDDEPKPRKRSARGQSRAED